VGVYRARKRKQGLSGTRNREEAGMRLDDYMELKL
jgi:hypothetical protein